MKRILVLAALGSTINCGGVDCGEGTFENGNGDCVLADPDDAVPPVVTLAPPGARTRDPLPAFVVISTDEPSRIFFSLDGTEPDPATSPSFASPTTVPGIPNGATLTYFAIDANGNRSATETSTYDSDATPPADVTNLAIAVAGTSATLTWANPGDPDFTTVVVGKVSDLVDARPEPGSTATVGAALSASIQVVQVGANTQFSDSGLIPGPTRYVVWTVDDLGNYSSGVTVRADVPIGSLTAQFTFDTNNNTLTRTVSPDNFDLSGTTATRVNNSVTLALSVKNLTATSLVNPKAEIAGVTNGTFTSSNGTADNRPFGSLGPNALGPGATVTKDLTFDVNPGTVVTIDLVLAQHAMLFATQIFNGNQRQRQLVFMDSATGQMVPGTFVSGALGRNGNVGQIRRPFAVGEHYIDIPTAHGQLQRWDLRTGSVTSGFSLDPDHIGSNITIMSTFAVAGHEIVVIRNGRYRSSGPISIVTLDEGFHRTGQLDIDLNDDRGNTLSALSPDGKTLAITGTNQIALIDVETLSVIDADPTTPGVDFLPTSITQRMRAVEFFDGSNGLYAISKNTNQGSFVRRTATGPVVTAANGSGRGSQLARTPDGRVFIGFEDTLRVFDPTTSVVSGTAYPFNPEGLTVADGKLFVLRTNRVTVDEVSSTGAVVRTFTFPTEIRGHWLRASR
jgi:hypothetical protein